MLNIGGRQMEKMVKQLGIQTEDVPADQVIIRSGKSETVINNPKVTKVKIAGQETFQIVGDVSIKQKEKFSSDDIKLVAEQTGVSESDARAALESEGDIAAAIMKLKN